MRAGLRTGDDLRAKGQIFWKFFPYKLGPTVSRHDAVSRHDTNMGTQSGQKHPLEVAGGASACVVPLPRKNVQ